MPAERYLFGDNDFDENDDFDPNIPRSIACSDVDDIDDDDDDLMVPQRRRRSLESSSSRRSKGSRRSTAAADKSPRALEGASLRKTSTMRNDRIRPLSTSSHAKLVSSRRTPTGHASSNHVDHSPKQSPKNHSLRASSCHEGSSKQSPLKPVDDIDYGYEYAEPVKRRPSSRPLSMASPRRDGESREAPKRIERKVSSRHALGRSRSKHRGSEPSTRRIEASPREEVAEPVEMLGSTSIREPSCLEPKRREGRATSLRRFKSRGVDHDSQQELHHRSSSLERRSCTPPREVIAAADDNATPRRLDRHKSASPEKRSKASIGTSIHAKHSKEVAQRVRNEPTSPSLRKVKPDKVGVEQSGNESGKEIDQSSRRKQRTISSRREESNKKSATDVESSCEQESPIRSIFQMISPKQKKKDPVGRSKSARVNGLMFSMSSSDKKPTTDSRESARASSRTRTTVPRSRTSAGMHTLLRAPSLSPVSTKERKVLRKPSGDFVLDLSPVPKRTVLRKPSSARSTSRSSRSLSQLPPATTCSDRASDNSTISSYNNDAVPAPVLQFDPNRSTALQVDLNVILVGPLKNLSDQKDSSLRTSSWLKPMLAEPVFSFDDEAQYSPFKKDTPPARVSSDWDVEEHSPSKKPQLRYPSDCEDDDIQPKQPTVPFPSGGEEDDEPNGDENMFDTSFSQIMLDSFHRTSFEPESGDEQLSHRKLENQRVKKIVKKKLREVPKALSHSTDCVDTTEVSTQRARRVKRHASGTKGRMAASSIAMNSSNGHLTDETETDDEKVQQPVLKNLAVTVSNNQTPYESEVDMTPRQTPLKKRLGFSQYFRGKMKSVTMSPGAARAETSDSELSYGDTKKKAQFRRGASRSMLLGSSGSEHEILPLS